MLIINSCDYIIFSLLKYLFVNMKISVSNYKTKYKKKKQKNQEYNL